MVLRDDEIAVDVSHFVYISSKQRVSGCMSVRWRQTEKLCIGRGSDLH